MISTTLTILFYSLATIFILYILGIGITILALPDKLKSNAFWLSPWYAMFFLIFFLVTFSLFGFSVGQISPFLIAFLLGFNIYVFVKQKIKINLNLKEDVVILIFILISILFNSSPLIRRIKMLTTLSLGNNDVLIYASIPDYFINHSIVDNYISEKEPLKPMTKGIDGMIQDNFRWGSPMIASFFMNIFNLKGYEYIYLFELILFSLAIPLVYLLFKILYKNSFYGLLFSALLFSFNSNLLYILYHNFFGQIFFWGIELFLLIHLVKYFHSDEINSNILNKSDFVIGLTFSVLFFSYHEAVIFIAAPMLVFLLISFIKNNKPIIYFQAFIRIFFITGITSFLSIIHALRIDFLQAGGLDAPIGWQLFREKIPFANPFEAMGFWSIHNFEPLPMIIAILLSIFIVIFIIKGFSEIKQKYFVSSFLVIYGLFYIWTAAIHTNFFAYNRALTYTLPLIIVLFAIGLIKYYEHNIKIGLIVLSILMGLIIYSGFKLNNRFLREYLAVDKQLISLSELNNNEAITEPIITEQVITGPTNLWSQFWTNYFLYPNKNIYTPFNSDITRNKISDNMLILISKPSKILLKKIFWENDYFKLGSICDNDDCLREIKYELNKIDIGNNNYEDNLLLSGWYSTEGDTRWANEKESTLRLVTKDIFPIKLTVEALSLDNPQVMAVYLNDELLGKISIDKEWKIYSLPVNYQLNPGVQKIKFVYSHGYRPMDVIPGNLDVRTLYVNFKEIKLE